MNAREDITLRHARREAWILIGVWAAATAYCCVVSVWLGYADSDRPASEMELNPILGIPAWFFWGVIFPWMFCGVFTLIFAGFVMRDDDLGSDHAAQLDATIREDSHAD